MNDKGLKKIALAIAGVGLAAVGAWLLCNGHPCWGTALIVIGVLEAP